MVNALYLAHDRYVKHGVDKAGVHFDEAIEDFCTSILKYARRQIIASAYLEEGREGERESLCIAGR